MMNNNNSGNTLEGKHFLIELGDTEEWIAESIAKDNPSLRNWQGAFKPAFGYDVYEITERGSNRSWTKRSTFRRGAKVQSWATVDGLVATFHHFGSVYSVKAPRGYQWAADDNGLKIVNRKGDDFHPNSTDLIRSTSDHWHLAKQVKRLKRLRVANARKLMAEMKAAQQKTNKQRAVIRTAEREGATVCLADSIRAGNCLPGSRSWAIRHKIDPKGHVKPSELLKLANGETYRIAIVVAIALKRHREEMERGYALLSQHRVEVD